MGSLQVNDNEPVFVFATNESGHHENEMAQLAMTRWGAQRSRGRGLVGNSYAIPVRNRNNENLSAERILAEFNAFKEFARANPKRQFLLSRIGCDSIGFTDEKVAPHFLDCPANVVVNGKWKNMRDRTHRVLAIVGSEKFDQREIIEWAVTTTVGMMDEVREFLVTDDEGVDFVSFQVLSERNLPVRAVVMDREKYGNRAGAVRNREMAFYATDVLILDDGSSAKCAHMRKTAVSEGLQVNDGALRRRADGEAVKPSDPEVARQKLEEVRLLAQKRDPAA